MNEAFELEAQLSAGKKSFKVISENGAYTLIESGSIAAVIKQNDDNWVFTTGSYDAGDAEIIGKLIEQNEASS
jgi:hypothetical protein